MHMYLPTFTHQRSTQKGFTLIELLIVVAILAILLIVTLVALKPAERLADARDARRGVDVNQILTGIHECVIDGDSDLTACLGTHTVGDVYEIVSSGITTGCDDVCTDVTSDTHCLALDSTLSDYFIELPVDPGTVATGHTEYTVQVYSNGMTVVESCSAENGDIKVSR